MISCAYNIIANLKASPRSGGVRGAHRLCIVGKKIDLRMEVSDVNMYRGYLQYLNVDVMRLLHLR